MANLLATKPISTIFNEARETGEHCLKRALGPSNLVALGLALSSAPEFLLSLEPPRRSMPGRP